MKLNIQSTQFTLDDKPTFLFGMSYYGGLGASDDFVKQDFSDLKRLGFNWVRVWATWSAFENDVSAVDSDGHPREPYLSRLKWLCEQAEKFGLVVDMTLSRGNGTVGPVRLQSLNSHLRAVETLAQELKTYRHVYFDLGNERNIQDHRFVSYDELKELRDAVKALDPQRLVTASYAGGKEISQEELREYLFKVQVDFISPHRARNAQSPSQTEGATRDYFQSMHELGRAIPVHYQEPFRRDFGNWQPMAEHFVADYHGAKMSGAAGWCLHNGSSRHSSNGRPRRSFDLRTSEGRLFDQLDAEERKAVQMLC